MELRAGRRVVLWTLIVSLGAVAVAAVLASILQPILRRVETPAPSRVRLVLELDHEPSPEAVTAAVEALARHGLVAQVVGRPGV